MANPTPTTISGLPTLTINALNAYSGTFDSVNDLFVVYQGSSASTVNVDRNTALGLSSAPLGLSDTQSPTNKTFDNTNTATLKASNFTLEDGTDTTKKAVFSLASITTGNTRTLTVPDYNGTIATLSGTETFTNKTLTSPTINSPTITNATISADAVTGYTTSNSGTIYGISVASGAISSNLSMTGTLSVTGATTLSSTLSTTGQPSFQTATAAPASGATTAGIKLSSTSNFGLFFGSGAPTFSAAQGSVYMRTDGSSTSTRLYINTTGSTTWTNVTTAA